MMVSKMKKAFLANIDDGLNTMLRHIEKNMDRYRLWDSLDNSHDKHKSRKAIMKDLSAKLPIGRQYRWLLSALIRDELKAEGRE
tara:strand:- start:305 stop:556 length:252 start_codon:yes stop_codon:yes gene_type:complete